MAEPASKSQPLWLVPIDAEAVAPVLKKLPGGLQCVLKAMTLQSGTESTAPWDSSRRDLSTGRAGSGCSIRLRQVYEIEGELPVFLIMHWESEGAMRSWQSRLLIDSVQPSAPGNFETPYNSYDLTRRELQVLRYMVQGLIKKEIAEQMTISFFTVNNHEVNIYRKLKVHTRSAAVAKALMEKIC